MNDSIVRPSAQPKPRRRCRVSAIGLRAMGERKGSVNRLVWRVIARRRPLCLEDASAVPAPAAFIVPLDPCSCLGLREIMLGAGGPRRPPLENAIAAGAVILEVDRAPRAIRVLERTDAGVRAVQRQRPAAMLTFGFHRQRAGTMSGPRVDIASLLRRPVSRICSHRVQHLVTPGLGQASQGEGRRANLRHGPRSLASPVPML